MKQNIKSSFSSSPSFVSGVKLLIMAKRLVRGAESPKIANTFVNLQKLAKFFLFDNVI